MDTSLVDDCISSFLHVLLNIKHIVLSNSIFRRALPLMMYSYLHGPLCFELKENPDGVELSLRGWCKCICVCLRAGVILELWRYAILFRTQRNQLNGRKMLMFTVNLLYEIDYRFFFYRKFKLKLSNAKYKKKMFAFVTVDSLK